MLSLGADRECGSHFRTSTNFQEDPTRAMADQMERALAIAVVQADETVSLGNALFATEWVIADLRRELIAANTDHVRTQRMFAVVSDGYEGVIAELRAELEMNRARLDSAVRLLGELERAVEQ